MKRDWETIIMAGLMLVLIVMMIVCIVLRGRS